MKKEYYDVYKMLYADYVSENEFRRRRPFPTEYYVVRTIRKSIDRADKEGKLRPDAKYFLLVNFHHLIVRPLIEQRPVRDFRIEKDYFELEANIQSDLETIIADSNDNVNQEEISGHQIMKSIDKLWKNLKTTKLEIWG